MYPDIIDVFSKNDEFDLDGYLKYLSQLAHIRSLSEREYNIPNEIREQ